MQNGVDLVTEEIKTFTLASPLGIVIRLTFRIPTFAFISASFVIKITNIRPDMGGVNDRITIVDFFHDNGNIDR